LSTRMLVSVWLVGFGVAVGGAQAWAQELVPDQYTMTIHYPDGRMNTLTGVESHQLISEKGATFLSVILKDGRNSGDTRLNSEGRRQMTEGRNALHLGEFRGQDTRMQSRGRHRVPRGQVLGNSGDTVQK